MTADREEILAQLIAEIQDQVNRGLTLDQGRYLATYPEFRDELTTFFDCESFLENALLPGLELFAARRDEAAFDLSAFPIRRRLPDVGIGAVYLIEGPDGADRELVVPRPWFTPQQRDRLERCARFAAARPIPGVLRIQEVGRFERVPYVVREHATGPTLADLAARLLASRRGTAMEQLLAAGSGPTETDDHGEDARSEIRDRLAADPAHIGPVCGLFAGWARVLERAHGAGLVHRELTPESLVVEPGGRAVIQGMGLAWSGLGVAASRMHHWNPQWFAPEIRDAAVGPITWKADVYGLGLAMRAFLALEDPASPDQDGLPRLPDRLAPELVELLESATTTALTARPLGLAAFADRLDQVASRRALTASAAAPRRSRRRDPSVLLLIAAVSAVAIALVLIAVSC